LIALAVGGENRSLRDRKLLAHNAALRYAIEYAGALPSIGPDPDSSPTLKQWMETDTPPPDPFALLRVTPPDLFRLTAMLLDGLDMRVRGRHPLSQPGDEATMFDHAALLAFAQVIHDAGGMSGARDRDTSTAFRLIAKKSPRALQKRLIENYLGNILHDYFDACEVRAAFPRLPFDTENNLRVKYGHAVAAAIFKSLPSRDGPLPAGVVQRALQEMLGSIWEGARTLRETAENVR
jgi:hypothetical protein